MRVLRLDAGETLARPRKMRGGGIRVDGFFTKPGVFPYVDAASGKTVLEYRPADEVFAPASLESWGGVPVTDGHPPDLVTVQTWSQYAIGQLGDEVRVDADRAAATLTIHRHDAVKAVQGRERSELSGGYWCDLDETPGTTPAGERYDRVQRGIEGNHVAVLRQNEARLGRDMVMRLDSAGHQVAESKSDFIPGPAKAEGGRVARFDAPQEKTMKIRFDGKSYDLSDEKDAARFEEVVAAQAQASADLKAAGAKLTAERDEIKARCDAADKRAVDADAKLAELPKLVAESVRARVELEVQARSVLGDEHRCDGKTDDEVRAAIREGMAKAIVEADPEAKLDGASDDYVRGRYDTVRKARTDAAAPQQSDPSLAAVRAAAVQAPRSAAAASKIDIGEAFRAAQAVLRDAK